MASSLTYLQPVKESDNVFKGRMVLNGSLTVQKPDGCGIIESVLGEPTNSLVPADTPATEINKCVKVSYLIAENGQSVTFYGWKHTSTSNPTLVASTVDARFDFSLVCSRF